MRAYLSLFVCGEGKLGVSQQGLVNLGRKKTRWHPMGGWRDKDIILRPGWSMATIPFGIDSRILYAATSTN